MPVPTSETYLKQKTPYRVDKFSIDITRIAPLWPKKVFIQWTLRKPVTATGYTFQVFKSGSPEGPWTLLTTTPLVDTYNYIDDTYVSPIDNSEPTAFSRARPNYYKVAVVGPAVSDEQVAPIEAGVDRRRRNIIRKLRRDAGVMLRKGNGTECAVFKRMWVGDPCDCKSLTGQIMRSHCTKCNGTGVLIGYFNPVYCWANRSETPITEDTAPAGKVERHYLQVKMLDVPLIASDDIIVFLNDGKRYIVTDTSRTSIHAVTVHQELGVSELTESAIEFNLQADKWHDPKWF